MKKLFVVLYLLANIFILGSCDVEGAGEPQPRQARVEVESENYYVQITQENLEGIAFVYRWLDMPTATKYVITVNAEGKEETIDVPNRSILTDNAVREIQFTNKEIMDYLDLFGFLTPGKESSMKITLVAYDKDGAPITADVKKASKTSTINVILAPDIELTNN